MADEEMITLETFGSRTQNDRITINGACYFVRELYDQIITLKGNVPHIQAPISDSDKVKLINAYKNLIKPVVPVESVESKQYDNIQHIEKTFPDDTNIINKYEYNY